MNIVTEKINLGLFGAGTVVNGTEGISDATTGNVTAYNPGDGLSNEMRQYYSDYLVDNAESALVHDICAQKVNIPAGNGKTIRFNKFNPLPTLDTPIVEGITPDGQKLNISTVNATVAQYGGYVELTDMLMLTAIDNNLCMATKLLGSQAGRTLDLISREVLVGGTNVQYGEGNVSARYLLVGGKSETEKNDYLTVKAIRKAVRTLKNQGAEKINGYYVAIVHPDCVYDLMNDPNWVYPHQYSDPSAIYEGEIGRIEGVRFVETPEAKIFRAEPLLDGEFVVKFTASDLKGNNTYFDVTALGNKKENLNHRWVVFNGKKYYTGILGDCLFLYETELFSNSLQITETADEYYICAEGAGAEGREVYATLIFGENAYGTTSIEGGGLEHIVKQLGSGGSNDPLNQRATVGWKASKVTERLVESFMIRVETTSSFES